MSIAEEMWKWVQTGSWSVRDERKLVDWIERIEKLEKGEAAEVDKEWQAMMEVEG